MSKPIRFALKYKQISVQLLSRSFANDGSIMEEGGKLAKKAAADESQYIRRIEVDQWKALKQHHDDEIAAHQRDIVRLKAKIKEEKEKLEKILHYQEQKHL